MWDQMVAEEATLNQIRADHGMEQARMETARYAQAGLSFGVSYKQGYRVAWWDAVAWLLRTQNGFDQLTSEEALLELRKGEGSIYWPLLRDDPRISLDCPGGHRTVVGIEGICDECGREVI